MKKRAGLKKLTGLNWAGLGTLNVMDSSCQDWTTVVIKRRSAVGKGGKPSDPRVQVSHEAKQMRALDDDDAHVEIKRLSPDSRQLIIQRRVELGWDQTKLNTMCSFPPHIIKEIEAGKAQPNPKQLTVLNRVLKANLSYSS